MIWKSSVEGQVDGRVPKIYGLPEAGASYKLNLRNYGSNYIGIKTITGASTISAYLGRLLLRCSIKIKLSLSYQFYNS